MHFFKIKLIWNIVQTRFDSNNACMMFEKIVSVVKLKLF